VSVNFIDTADIYSGGHSEEIVRKFVAASKARDEVVIAIKFGFKGTNTPHNGGNEAKNIHRALNGSLKRLGTNYIDMYWMHVWDAVTPVEENLQTLGDLVRVGKIRYFGFADMPAWVAIKAAVIANIRGIERALIAGAIDCGMDVQP
jgi:aryl-alcohol dehydrogenase-like predicted oxidoreductase